MPRSARWRPPSNGSGWRAEYRALSLLQGSADMAIVSARRRAQARLLAAALPPAGHGGGRRTGGCRTIDPWNALWGDPRGECGTPPDIREGGSIGPNRSGSRRRDPGGISPQGMFSPGNRPGIQAVCRRLLAHREKLLGRYRPGAGACQDECTRGWALDDGVYLRRRRSRRLIASLEARFSR